MYKALRKVILDDLAAQLEPLGFVPRVAHTPHDLYRQCGPTRQNIHLSFGEYGVLQYVEGVRIYQESCTVYVFSRIRYEPIHDLVRQCLHLKRDVFGEFTLGSSREGWIEQGREQRWGFSPRAARPYQEALSQALETFDHYHSLEPVFETLLERHKTSLSYDSYPLWTMAAAYLAGRRDVFETIIQKRRPSYASYYQVYDDLLARILRKRFDAEG